MTTKKNFAAASLISANLALLATLNIPSAFASNDAHDHSTQDSSQQKEREHRESHDEEHVEPQTTQNRKSKENHDQDAHQGHKHDH